MVLLIKEVCVNAKKTKPDEVGTCLGKTNTNFANQLMFVVLRSSFRVGFYTLKSLLRSKFPAIKLCKLTQSRMLENEKNRLNNKFYTYFRLQ